ncbi:MAG: type IV secretion system DNA-binding domain-containing protein [Chitinophagaceae bacterium]|nr:type IV secretion system DNA-binding domain-containing protein [Chitinophagaceae bacterium]
MVSAKVEALTAQFYEWEILGRGWLFANEPVDLEPPYTPFFGHFIRRGPIVDDGMRHTLFSSLASVFKSTPQQKVIEQTPEVSYELFPGPEVSQLVCLELRLAKHSKASATEIEQLLIMLSYCKGPISFEIIGTNRQIRIQFVSRVEDAQYIKSQLATLLKNVSVIETEIDENTLIQNEVPFATVDFGLKEEFMRPLNQLKGSAMDPLTGLFSILEYIGEGEQVIFQILFNGVVNHWQSSIIKSVSDAKGGAFFEDAPEMLPLAKEKVSAPLYCATVRILTQAKELEESLSLLRKVAFALVTNTRSQGNALLPLNDEEYTAVKRATDIAFRESHRSGMILNVKELATFIHLPDSSLISRKVSGETKKTKALPPIAQGHTFKLGQSIHNGIENTATLSGEQRLKHTHIIGATGTGKSTLLLSMINQDIESGQGVAVLDPHGDLIDTILTCIPKSRLNDVLIIDPADSDFPIGFNILKAHSDIEKEVLSSDLVAAFRKLSTSWGDQMNSVFANAILAFLESSKGGTLIDLRRFLIERPYRETFLKTVSDPSISYYWQKEYPLLKTNSIGPILTRLDSFLRPRLIRNMLAQPQGIDFEQILNSRKILLVKLSQGLIGSENSYLLGTFVVSKIHQAALARQAQEKRNDFFLYIDEFQHFVTPSMAHILSGARKYHLGLILAHQDIQQVQKNDSELLNTLIANASTRICFRLGDSDAKKLAEGFSFFEASDLQNLGTGEAIVRIERPEYDFNLSTIVFERNNEYAEREFVIEQSRQRYSMPKAEVEAMLIDSMGTQEILQADVKEESITAKPIITKRQTEPKIPVSEELTPENIKSNPENEKQVVQKKTDTQHSYLQSLIKKIAESKGYKATIEMPTPDGKGLIDVVLEKEEDRIAVEVSVTTDSAWELHNVEKCVSAGFKKIFVCSYDEKMKKQLSKQVSEKLPESDNNKIYIGEPEELFDLLSSKENIDFSTETNVKGYRVKVEYENMTNTDMQKKRESISRIINESIRKMKK